MKVTLGPTDMVFNKITTPIVDGTLELVNDYNKDLFELSSWLNVSAAEIKVEYEKRQKAIIEKFETAIQKQAIKIAK